MNHELVSHFERVADAPDAVPRLRHFILDLAVRGRLVEQDPEEEDATALLKRIQVARAQPVKAEDAPTRQKPILSVDESKIPFRIPETWAWVPATYPAQLISDSGKKIQTKDVLEVGQFPVVDQGKVFIRGFCNDKSKVIHVEEPIVLFGDHTRETKLIDFDFVVGADGVKLLRPICVLPRFYHLALTWLPLDSRGYGRHFKLLRAAAIPLPPLPEQHRIVARVDELMALCDEFETAQAERENRRDLLVSALLNRLSQSDEATHGSSFQEYASFYLSHILSLTTRSRHVAALRRTILELMVRGKLTEQSASEWTRSRLGEVGKWGSGGTPSKSHPEYYGGMIPWLVIRDLNDGVVTEATTHISEAGLQNSSAKLVESGTVLVAMYGSIGKLAIAGIRCATNQAIAFCVPDPAKVRTEFLLLSLRGFRHELELRGQGGTQKNISQAILKSHPIMLPPLTEQDRIVAKVDQIMAMCEELESQLNGAHTGRQSLLDALLYQALASPN